jgi:uncharacterized protein (DUF983 family)
MNSKPSTPLCPNCLNTQLYCDANLYLESQPCCTSCEHGYPPAIRPTHVG